MEVRIAGEANFGEACLAALLEAVGDDPSPVVGLPTGNTPVALFGALAGAVTTRRVNLSTWKPFAIDEYGGPQNHPCSNHTFFRRYWDSIQGARPVEQFDPDAPNLAEETARFGRELERAGGLTVSVLGIGKNGHLAFNEPGCGLDSTTRCVELQPESRESGRVCWADETPTWGLTLGIKELFSARTVVVMANGPAKAEIVARAIDGPETSDCPASMVRRVTRAIWVLDDSAAAKLRRA